MGWGAEGETYVPDLEFKNHTFIRILLDMWKTWLKDF